MSRSIRTYIVMTVAIVTVLAGAAIIVSKNGSRTADDTPSGFMH